MVKIRISSLAKELGIKSGLVIEKCHEHGLGHINHHANAVDEQEAALIRSLFAAKATPEVTAPPIPPKEVEKGPQVLPPEEKKPVVGVKPSVKPTMEVPVPEKVLSKLIRPTKLIEIPRRPAFRRRGREAGPRWRKEVKRPTKETAPTPRPSLKGLKLVLEPPITVKDLSSELGVKASTIITKLLMEHNIHATMNQTLDEDVVALLGMELGAEIEFKKVKVSEEAVEKEFEMLPAKPEELVPRPPIVTFMGHVDHGKTSLLDVIRKTSVAAGEVGGITQHIGASRVETNGRAVVFLDTPGHEAFTQMRARGSQVTDVAVLVVAADDGVMPQTEEALNHARAAGVPVVVAVNKIDKPGANPQRVKQQLAKLGLVPEEWGGKTQFVETSAMTKQGLDELLERLLLEAEILELKANPKNPAKGVVLDARLHEGRGVVATIIVQDGTLRLGDIIFCGQAFGRIRAMYNDRGKEVREAGPSYPVSVSGLSTVPEAGEKFYVVRDIQKAKEIATERQKKFREAGLQERRHVTLENLYNKIEEGKVKELKVILKADVKGSVEVLDKMLEELSTEEVKVRILHSGVGGITESDAILADASDAVIIGFYVTPEEGVSGLAEERGVEIRLYQVIYDVSRDIKAAMEGMLEPERKEVLLGHAEIKQVFRVSKMGNVAGCFVKTGKIIRNALIRVVREGNVIHEGKLASLRIVKDDVKEVRQGLECGMKVAGFDDLKVGDIIEAYEVQQIARTLSG